jgi:hypothetical protein
MSMAYIGIALAVGTTIYGAAESSNQKRRGRHAREELEKSQPADKIPDELIHNQELGKLRANTGLASEQYAMAQKAIARQQAKTLKGAGDRRMGLGLLASIDDNANRAQADLDARNAQARLNNEHTLMGVNNQVATWKTNKTLRDQAKWDNNMDYARAVEGSGKQNQVNTIMSGINAAGLIAGAAYRGGSNSNFASSLFGGRRGTGAGTGSGGDANGGNLRLNSAGYLIDANGNVVNQ